MASKLPEQDAKCSRAVCIDCRNKQPSQKKSSFNSKFDALINWQCIFCDSNCRDEPFDRPSIECFSCKQFTQINCSQLSDLEIEYLSKSENMKLVCNN